MHSAILAVDSPSDSYMARAGWKNFAAEIAPAEGNQAVKRLGPNVWQVNFQQAPDALAQLILGCKNFGYSYKILQFDAEPQWIEQAPDNPIAKTG
jgi:hypothetical protein